MTRYQNVLALVGLCFLLPAAGIADEQDPDPDRAAIHIRHALMELMAWNVQPISNMAMKKQPYDGNVATQQGQRILQLAFMIPDAFARNTSASDAPTHALANIWKEPEKFQSAVDSLIAAATAYSEAAAGGEAGARKAFVELGNACKGCHEDFRAEDDD